MSAKLRDFLGGSWTDFSLGASQARWHSVYLKCWRERSCQPRILCVAKLSFENEGEIKTCSVYKSWESSASAQSPSGWSAGFVTVNQSLMKR